MKYQVHCLQCGETLHAKVQEQSRLAIIRVEPCDRCVCEMIEEKLTETREEGMLRCLQHPQAEVLV